MLFGMTRSQRVGLVLAGLCAVVILGALGVVLLNGQLGSAPVAPTAQALEPVATPTVPAPTVERTPSTQPDATAAPLVAYTPTFAPTVVNPQACLGSLGAAEEALGAVVLEDGGIQAELVGKPVVVRLIGVEPVGSDGPMLALLRELVAGKALRLYRDGQEGDAQGGLRRYVLAGDRFINYEMVRHGAALPALFPPGMTCTDSFLAAERLARAENLGYWSLQPDLPGGLTPVATTAALACDCAQSYACTDFKTRAAAQSCYNACGDYRNTTLDPDHNGLACEALP